MSISTTLSPHQSMKGFSATVSTCGSEHLRSNLFCTSKFNKVKLVDDLLGISDLPVSELMKQHITSLKVSDESDLEAENAFFVADLGEVYRQHLRWKTRLPRVEPFYAVKCNPDSMMLKLLAALGVGFDCASKLEIQTILSMGVDPGRIIYANPCKQASFIRYAAQKEVRMMTFDNVDELHKIKQHFPSAQLVLRILADDSKSLCRLGLKFGASLESVDQLLQTAQNLELDVIGVSFHVGSGCYDEEVYADAVWRARVVFDKAARYNFNFSLLDVGGGFSHLHNGDGITFEKIANVLDTALKNYFPEDIRIIAEPGRYYAAPAYTIATQIIARRPVLRNQEAGENDFVDSEQKLAGDEQSFMYYINDGVYGAFNCILFDHQIVHPKVLIKDDIFYFDTTMTGESEYSSSVWGPTCDSIDCVNKDSRLPELFPGDWLYFEEMGAYTISAASQFNGFMKSNVLYTSTENKVFEYI
ncbi:193_t:CDS:2 [Paraglomus brasilianum]|uniref:ornithine decarboxylase n=1 Tax=Paraglomus brasilianum TaxID=144538 RepID=A0A9N9A2S3_9GLOM|nr:193_t:CDS:2 [Paraglomus brasilianum]